MIKVIIFDLQGTLLENGIYPSPTKQVRFILGIRRNFHEYVPEFEKVFMTRKFDNLSQGFHTVAEAFDLNVPEFVIEKLVGVWNKNKLLSKLFPETLEVLSDLKEDHKIVLVANIDCFSKDVIEKYKLDNYFDAVYLSCDTGLLKSDTILFDKIINDLSISKDEAIIVGDSVESDMMNAAKAGIKSLLLDRNDRMAYEDKIVSLKDLRKYLSR